MAVVTLDYVTLGNYIADAERSSLGQLMRSMRVVRAFRLVRLLKMARFDAPRQRSREWLGVGVHRVEPFEPSNPKWAGIFSINDHQWRSKS